MKADPRGRSALRTVQKYHPAVTSVVDAKKGTTIEVTRKDCSSSKSKAPDACALASAFCREHDGAIISMAVAYLIDGKKAIRYRVPSRISREIVSFDRSHKFEPGTYSLKAPSSTEKLAAIRARRASHPSQKVKGGVIKRAYRTAGIRSL